MSENNTSSSKNSSQGALLLDADIAVFKKAYQQKNSNDIIAKLKTSIDKIQQIAKDNSISQSVMNSESQELEVLANTVNVLTDFVENGFDPDENLKLEEELVALYEAMKAKSEEVLAALSDFEKVKPLSLLSKLFDSLGADKPLSLLSQSVDSLGADKPLSLLSQSVDPFKGDKPFSSRNRTFRQEPDKPSKTRDFQNRLKQNRDRLKQNRALLVKSYRAFLVQNLLSSERIGVLNVKEINDVEGFDLLSDAMNKLSDSLEKNLNSNPSNDIYFNLHPSALLPIQFSSSAYASLESVKSLTSPEVSALYNKNNAEINKHLDGIINKSLQLNKISGKSPLKVLADIDEQISELITVAEAQKINTDGLRDSILNPLVDSLSKSALKVDRPSELAVIKDWEVLPEKLKFGSDATAQETKYIQNEINKALSNLKYPYVEKLVKDRLSVFQGDVAPVNENPLESLVKAKLPVSNSELVADLKVVEQLDDLFRSRVSVSQRQKSINESLFQNVIGVIEEDIQNISQKNVINHPAYKDFKELCLEHNQEDLK